MEVKQSFQNERKEDQYFPFYGNEGFFFFLNLHPRTCLLILERGEGREREGERNMDVSNIDWLPPLQVPTGDQTLNLQPKHVPPLGIQPATFGCTGRCSNQ